MRQLLVFGDKTFKITVPDDAKITFGPWSPPTGQSRYDGSREALRGTLRVYKTEKDVMAVFSGVSGYRDLSLGYLEQVAKEEGDTIWKDDEQGYTRQSRVSRKQEWVAPTVPALPVIRKSKAKRKEVK